MLVSNCAGILLKENCAACIGDLTDQYYSYPHVWGMQGVSEQYFGDGLSVWDFSLQVPSADHIDSSLVSGCDCTQWD